MRLKTTITKESAAAHHVILDEEFTALFADATKDAKIPVYMDGTDSMPIGYAHDYDRKENEVEFTSQTHFMLPSHPVMRPDFKGSVANGRVDGFKLLCFTMIEEPRIQFQP